MNTEKKRFYIETFGCQMNVNDSERVAGLLGASGNSPADAPDRADFVFVNEGGPRDEEMPELGRFPRAAVKDVDVVDAADQHVPEPATESLDEPDALAKVVVAWQPEGADVDRDEFAFRSAWAAWEAAHRFRRFAEPPLLS